MKNKGRGLSRGCGRIREGEANGVAKIWSQISRWIVDREFWTVQIASLNEAEETDKTAIPQDVQSFVICHFWKALMQVCEWCVLPSVPNRRLQRQLKVPPGWKQALCSWLQGFSGVFDWRTNFNLIVVLTRCGRRDSEDLTWKAVTETTEAF